MRYTLEIGRLTVGPMDIFQLTGTDTDRLTGIPGAGELVMAGMLRAAMDNPGKGGHTTRWEFRSASRAGMNFTVRAIDDGEFGE